MHATTRRQLGMRACQILIAAAVALGLTGRAALAQLPSSEEQLKIMTDPESIKKELDKDKSRPPIELFRTQVAPFDVLPFVKANHWTSMGVELRANYNDYAGLLQTTPVAMAGLPQEIIYRRDARLTKTQRSKLMIQVMLPRVPKEIQLELSREDAIRASDVWPATLRVLEQDQMLVVMLTKETSDVYATWNRFQAMYPNTVDRGDLNALDKARYYRLALPIEPEKPPLSPHPLCWTAISHVVWDGLPPDRLNPSQQQAMLDWVHWGGQLTIVGGAGPAFSVLKDSFLDPYLPADVSGDNVLLSEAELKLLSQSYRPPFVANAPTREDDEGNLDAEPARPPNRRYLAPAPIRPRANQPVYLTGLSPREGAVGIPLAESGGRLIGVEKRVGRGRILMLGLGLTDPALASWTGLDTFVRRVVLRRPEESREAQRPFVGRGFNPGRSAALPGPDLSWVRFASRDLRNSTGVPPLRADGRVKSLASNPPPGQPRPSPEVSSTIDDEEASVQTPDHAVAEWLDASVLPRFAREVLEEASGIKIPGADFVLKVILAYTLALVPLNWLVCRYLLARRELAWVVVPLLAFGFAIGVERAAAYDLGYNSACDEIDVLETYGGYPRAHVSRFASLYTTGRSRYSISYPEEPSALVLPMDNGRSLRGEDVSTSAMQSYPVPSLTGYLVQPRSLAFFRAEEMVTLDGSIRLETPASGGRRVVNEGRLEILDAVLVEYTGQPGRGRETYLGKLGAGESVEVTVGKEAPERLDSGDAAVFHSERLLRLLREDHENRPEAAGEIRLVGWAEKPWRGQRIEPEVDRHRGFTAVVVHLTHAPPPSPSGPVYDSLVTRGLATVEPNGARTGPDGSPSPPPRRAPARVAALPPLDVPAETPADRPETQSR